MVTLVEDSDILDFDEYSSFIEWCKFDKIETLEDGVEWSTREVKLLGTTSCTIDMYRFHTTEQIEDRLENTGISPDNISELFTIIATNKRDREISVSVIKQIVSYQESRIKKNLSSAIQKINFRRRHTHPCH